MNAERPTYRTWRPILVFFLVTVLISWTAWGVMALLGVEPGLDLGGLLWLLGGFGPPIAAILVTEITEGRAATRELLGRLFRWRPGWRWYGVALLLPGVVVVGAVVIDAVIWDVDTALPTPAFVLLFVGLVVVSSVIGGGQEEIGWRGFALPRVQASYSALTASLLVGVMWTVWHFPLFVVPGTVQTDLPLLPFVVQGIALAVVFTWLYNSTGGNLLLAVLLHGSHNAWISSVWLLRDEVAPTTFWVITALVCLLAVGMAVVYGSDDLARQERQRA